MKTRVASTTKREVEERSARAFWISGLVIALAVGACIAVYKHSGSFQVNLPVAATPADANETARPAPSTAGTPPRKTSAPEMKQVAFGPTVPNTTALPAKAPQGMALIPGGEFSMGAQNPPDMDDVGMKATLDSRPVHRV